MTNQCIVIDCPSDVVKQDAVVPLGSGASDLLIKNELCKIHLKFYKTELSNKKTFRIRLVRSAWYNLIENYENQIEELELWVPTIKISTIPIETLNKEKIHFLKILLGELRSLEE